MIPSAPTPGSRETNLGRLVRILHENGPHSRASLTEITGLNRSTVAALIADLAGAGLAEESAPLPSSRAGRPSPTVLPSERVVAIAVHPEVDAIEMAAISLSGSIVVRVRIASEGSPTPTDVADIVAAELAQWRTGRLRSSAIVGMGVAVPGLIDSSAAMVRNAPHLGWVDVPLGPLLSESCGGIPTSLGNDANLAALAEHLFGSGRGEREMIYLNGGASGIGGGLVIDGHLAVGARGYAGEFGHTRPRIDDPRDRRVAQGALEDEVNRGHLLDLLGLTDASDESLALAAAESTAAEVRDELRRQARVLGGELAGALNVLNPSAIVLGGYLAVISELAGDELRNEISRLALRESFEGAMLRTAALGADRLLIGAAELAFRPLWDDPLAVARDADRSLEGVG